MGDIEVKRNKKGSVCLKDNGENIDERPTVLIPTKDELGEDIHILHARGGANHEAIISTENSRMKIVLEPGNAVVIYEQTGHHIAEIIHKPDMSFPKNDAA
jgi:hypothetical protein